MDNGAISTCIQHKAGQNKLKLKMKTTESKEELIQKDQMLRLFQKKVRGNALVALCVEESTQFNEIFRDSNLEVTTGRKKP